MAPSVTNNVCEKCKREIESKYFLTCTVCKKHFDLECTGTEKRFFSTMTCEHKKTWRCMFCLSSMQRSSSPKLQDNITFRANRKANIQLQNSFEVLSDTISEEDEEYASFCEENVTKNCPKCDTNKSCETNELRNIISALENQLKLSKTKIDYLESENKSLKDLLSRNNNKSVLRQSYAGCPPKSDNKKQTLNTKPLDSSTSTSQIIEQDKYFNQPKQSRKSRKHKLLVISSNNKHKILSYIRNEEQFEKYECCHFIKTRRGIKDLLQDIDSKLQSYTKMDHCVILIGDADFKYSQNYENLVNYIRTKLENIRHTNITIACPTYICGAPVFNSRAEAFTTLLQADIEEHQYAYFHDSNGKLTFNMFSDYSGQLLNSGMKCLLYNIAQLLNVVNYKYSSEQMPIVSQQPEIENSTDSYFVPNPQQPSTSSLNKNKSKFFRSSL